MIRVNILHAIFVVTIALTNSGAKGASSLNPKASHILDKHIVVFKKNIASDRADEIVRTLRLQNNVHTSWKRVKVINGFIGKLAPQTLKHLSDHPAVDYIEKNRIVGIDNGVMKSSRNSQLSWGLDRIDQSQLPLDGSYNSINDGRGTHVYILDSGIRTTHNEFGDRAFWDFTASDINEGDEDHNGHGTHIAGIVGSESYGVAKNANIHAVKVLNSQGQGTLAGLIEGINYVTVNHQSPAIATIGFSTTFSRALNDAISNSINAGVLYAVPSGDNFKDACDFSPGSVNGVLTVASTDRYDRVSNPSNRGECVDLYAPGIYIKSLWHTNDFANNTISHSPMSAAFVAGVSALIRSSDSSCSVEQAVDRVRAFAHQNKLSNVPNSTPNLIVGLPTANIECTINNNEYFQYDHLVQLAVNSQLPIEFISLGETPIAKNGKVEWDPVTSSYVYTPHIGFKGVDIINYQKQGANNVVRVEVGLMSNSAEVQVPDPNELQNLPSVAILSNSDIIISWEENGPKNKLYYQRYNAFGEALTSETLVSPSSGEQLRAQVTALNNGGFVVIWTELISRNNYDMFGQKFNADGSLNGSTFSVSGFVPGLQMESDITTLKNGRFVTVWDDNYSNELKGNIYEENGEIVRRNIGFFPGLQGLYRQVSVLGLSNGQFIVAGNVGGKIVTQKYSADGATIGVMNIVSEYDTGSHFQGQISLQELDNNHYVVGWSSNAAQDESGWSIMARLYSFDGNAITDEILVNQHAYSSQLSVRFSLAGNDTFLAVWESNGAPDGDDVGVMGRQYHLSGTAISDEFRVVGEWLGAQRNVSIEQMNDGRIAIGYSDDRRIKLAMLSLGSSNADIFRTDNDNNVFIGNDGIDTVIFSGKEQDYSIVNNRDGSKTVIDNRTGSPDGENLLLSIELLRFTD